MADLLTENVLPVLGLCPPASLLLPWLAQARALDGRTLNLPTNAGAATFAVARRAAQRDQGSGGGAPVAAVLLEDEAEPGQMPQATLVMMDWLHELSPQSGIALQRSEARLIFGVDLPIRRRCLLALSADDTQPHKPLRELQQRCSLPSEELGWLGLRPLLEVLTDYLSRLPRERWRAPERTAHELILRMSRHGVGPLRPVRPPSPSLMTQLAGRPPRRLYEPLRPGTPEFPYRFLVGEDALNQAMVLEARRLRRKAPLEAASPGPRSGK